MNTALLHIIEPTLESELEEIRWYRGLFNIFHIEGQKTPNMKMLARNIWEIPLDTGVPFLSSVCHQLGIENQSYRISFLDTPLVWLEYPKA